MTQLIHFYCKLERKQHNRCDRTQRTTLSPAGNPWKYYLPMSDYDLILWCIQRFLSMTQIGHHTSITYYVPISVPNYPISTTCACQNWLTQMLDLRMTRELTKLTTHNILPILTRLGRTMSMLSTFLEPRKRSQSSSVKLTC